MTDRQVVLHVSPHPDDEAIGAGMTVTSLAANGWQVVNLLTSAGRPGEEPRRLAEAAEAARRGGFQLEVETDVAAAIERHRPALVMSPQPRDVHPTHEAVAASVRDALERRADPPIWWMWGLWAELAVPTLYVPFGEVELARALDVLAAYEGELARNDYRRVVRGRASSNTVIGSERIFGFGSASVSDQPFAELLTEAVHRDAHWYAGTRRVVDLAAPFGDEAISDQRLDEWISGRPR